ncbi:uncharacterized protein [Narcine bancroftii]|uniref:uncharacterized protein n=1 Tax=Narcine bancroftii TaxID=1343680 RepID=UPI003831C348
MSPAENLRQVLVEIPNPQPKVAVHLRRSYEEILNSTRAQTRLMALQANVPPAYFLRKESHSGLPFKKRRLHLKPAVKIEVKLNDLLSSQLVETLLLHRYPAIDDEDMKLIFPSLIMKFVQEQLELIKSNIYRSIPRWRLGSNRDAYCYRKARNHIQAFQKTCLEQGKLLLQAECWETALNYILVAWRYTSELPQWDISFHNECTEQCFTVLAVQGITALQRSCLDMEKHKQLKKRFKIAYTQNKLIKPCLEKLDSMIVVLECSP